MKHIESIQPEYAADELDRIVREEGDATATAALTALLHSVTGCDIPQTSYLPESEVEELVPLCVSILRRHWQTPLTCLGDGTTPMSLSDLMRQTIGDRVQGNEAWSIPAVHANLPTALAALRERKIGGVPQAPDGISIGNLIASPFVEQITEIDDSANKYNPIFNYNVFLSLFPNLRKFVLGAEIIDNYWCKVAGDLSSLEEFEAPHLRVFSGVHGGTWAEMFLLKNCNTGNLTFPSLEEVHTSATSGFFIINNTTMEEFHAPLLRDVRSCADNWAYKYLAYTSRFLVNCTALKKVVTDIQYVGNIHANASQLPFTGSPNIEFIKVGQLKSWNNGFLRTSSTDSMPNLVHLEIGEGTAISLDFQYWQPTTALSERLDEFLSNFQTYIADRVADRTGNTALTLTLSAAVYEALQAQEGQTILATLTNKNWTVAQA